ncbi:hypothetical protein [Parasitella parasitica]|uniref:Uncharacterized protein n=1 Tax=Parasitella parasitica TaxID=35722 RepID=A0A0B7NSR5_9FUNG|nr:hypothetical protein [Parasitella parasitica]
MNSNSVSRGPTPDVDQAMEVDSNIISAGLPAESSFPAVSDISVEDADYESLAPGLVGAHNEILSRITEISVHFDQRHDAMNSQQAQSNAAFNSFASAVLFQLHQLSSQQEALMAQQQTLLGSVLVPSAPSRQQPVPLQPAPSHTTATPTTSGSSTPQCWFFAY